jgi:hypothetical protein
MCYTLGVLKSGKQGKIMGKSGKKLLVIGALAVSLLSIGGCGASKQASTSKTGETTTKTGTTKSKTVQSTKEATTSSQSVKKVASTSSVASTSETVATKIDLANTYYSKTGATATVAAIDADTWQIDYATADGAVTATFKTQWQVSGNTATSTTGLTKSDGYQEFNMRVTRNTDQITKDDQPLITLTMSDGNANHELTFTNEKVAASTQYDSITTGDLSAFVGTYSTDAFEQAIKDSNFRMGGYNPEDYYQKRTSNFNSISKDGLWFGGVHASYGLNLNKLPVKINGYYEVYFVGKNSIAIIDEEMSILLVPENVAGPDGSVSSEKRFFYGVNYQQSNRPYHDNWWEN